MACLCEQIAGNDIELSPTCIGHLWIFQNLEADEIEALSREALRKKSTRGQPLFLQGDPADEMFLIKGGRVKLSNVLEDGTELTLDLRKAGDFIGENMFAEEGHYPASAYCLFRSSMVHVNLTQPTRSDDHETPDHRNLWQSHQKQQHRSFDSGRA